MIEISNVTAQEALKALESRVVAMAAMADMEPQKGVAMQLMLQSWRAEDAIAKITEALENAEK